MESNKAFCYRCSLVIVILDSWAVRSVHEHSFEQRSGWPFSLLNDDSYICLKKSVYFPHLQTIWNDSIETTTFTHPNRFGVEKIHIPHGGSGHGNRTRAKDHSVIECIEEHESWELRLMPVDLNFSSRIWDLSPSKTPPKADLFLHVAEIWHPNKGSRDAFLLIHPFSSWLIHDGKNKM